MNFAISSDEFIHRVKACWEGQPFNKGQEGREMRTKC